MSRVTRTALVSLAPSPDDLYTTATYYLNMCRLDDAMPCLLRAAESDHIEAALIYARLLNPRHSDEATMWYQRILHLAKGRSNEMSLSSQAHGGLAALASNRLCYGEALGHLRQGALLGDAVCQYFMVSRNRAADVNDASSSKTAQKRLCGSDNKDPTAAAATAVASSPVVATPAGAATVVARAPDPARDKRRVSRVTRTALVSLAPSPDRLYTTAMYYLNRCGLDDAMPYLLRAAESDHIEAALIYARLLNPRHSDEATTWYQRILHLAKGRSNEMSLSSQAHGGLAALASNRLCYGEALGHYRQGALLGDADCQYYLGQYLHQGRGQDVLRDIQAAYYWYRLAEAGGSRSAASALGLACLPSSPLPLLFLSDADSLLF